jgi:hypothetical protein
MSRKFSHERCHTVVHSAYRSAQSCTGVYNTDVPTQCFRSGCPKEKEDSCAQRPPCTPVKIPGALAVCAVDERKEKKEETTTTGRRGRRVGEIRSRNLALLPC